METVLAKIVADKRKWIAARKTQQPLDSFFETLTPSDRDFLKALSSPNSAFILECKKASPSKGLIREDFDLDYIASVYRHHANAISVLTDEKYFQGNFDFLPQVRRQVTQPILCKDFMVDPYQVYLARHYQADAILLMLSVLDDEDYQQLAKVAKSLSMGILTEVSTEEELERAIQLGAEVVGINNRNLRDLSIDLARTKALAPRLPEGTIIISESGIYTHQQIKELRQYANGFLIGSSLMADDNLELAVRRVLLGENKVCGLTRAQDSLAAYQAGAVFGGLIFAPASPRCITTAQAKSVMAAAPLRYVGVFQNQPLNNVAETAKQLKLTAVQLHGDEDEAYIQLLRQQLASNCEIWKAYGVDQQEPQRLNHVDRHLLDSRIGTQTGGTGQSFDWHLIEDFQHVMLAGGIGPENAKQAAQLGAIGLDINSAVESAPGIKDNDKLAATFAAIKQF
ncbi:bifunctional indole-3-glycerol-phosphate synthase TrpC/phosphoribosylanthranilate isomerase TrpF [Thaumasiovibrio sp. DFM-14]|uniref:bifunctional indole-3-glycerol-phosphate synthase TrpC/phosphoribosylanthranilate isomerase TrpF n=1 Tax=Thaumasiovibrio sp. DFM-14 TaxID=3384792 RepID=UPI0039A330DD